MNLFKEDPNEVGSNWGGYANWAWEKPSYAVVACDGHGNGCVLYTGGPAVACELSEVSRDLSDIGLDDAPRGLSVWCGKAVTNRSGEYGQETDFELVGQFRSLTPEEQTAVLAGRSPWDEKDWGVAEERTEQNG